MDEINISFIVQISAFCTKWEKCSIRKAKKLISYVETISNTIKAYLNQCSCTFTSKVHFLDNGTEGQTVTCTLITDLHGQVHKQYSMYGSFKDCQ